MAGIEKIIIALGKLFDTFNKHYYNDELIKPVIAVQTNGKEHQIRGWCTLKKVWKDKLKGEEFYEITICAEHLDRNIEEICTTLLHEMVHLYHLQNEIKGVSRGGTYHNKRFKATAEEKGLIITYDKKIGWSISELNEEAKIFINGLYIDEEAFTLTRKGFSSIKPKTSNGIDEDDNKDGSEKPKHSTRKYICPNCEMTVRATKEVNIMCGDCFVKMEKEEK